MWLIITWFYCNHHIVENGDKNVKFYLFCNTLKLTVSIFIIPLRAKRVREFIFQNRTILGRLAASRFYKWPTLTTQTQAIRRGALRFATQISPLLNCYWKLTHAVMTTTMWSLITPFLDFFWKLRKRKKLPIRSENAFNAEKIGAIPTDSSRYFS